MPARRICSLLPSATEIMHALGLGDLVVAVTHECDFPPEAASKPRATRSAINSEGMSGREIDQAVREALAEQETIYHLDRDLLKRLQPDLVITQELCEVCAVGTREVQEVMAALEPPPAIVSLEPRTLAEVIDSVQVVARLAGCEQRGEVLAAGLRHRVETVREAAAGSRTVRVLTLEWVDPPFVGGHWMPEMVELAGGVDVLGQAGAPSRQVSWADIAESEPEVVVAMPCGFGVERSVAELERAALPEEWYRLPAVRDRRVYVVDGSSYFSRPGPRLIGGIEILAAILHPDRWDSTPGGSFRHFPSDRSTAPTPAGT